MAAEVAPRQLGERGVAVRHRARIGHHVGGQRVRVAREHERAAARREPEQVRDDLPLGGEARGAEPVREVGARARAVGERPLDHAQRPRGRGAQLGQPALGLRAHERAGQRVQPAEVLDGDEVERAAQQPRRDQRGLVDPLRAAGAQRDPGGARVLRLDGEQPPHDVRRGALPRHEQLRRGAAPAQLGDPHPATTSR